MHMHECLYLYCFMRLSSRSINGFLFCFLTPCGIVALRIALWGRLIRPWSPSATPCSPCAFRNYLTPLRLDFFSDPSQSLLFFLFFFLLPISPICVCMVQGWGIHVYHNLSVESEDIFGSVVSCLPPFVGSRYTTWVLRLTGKHSCSLSRLTGPMPLSLFSR